METRATIIAAIEHGLADRAAKREGNETRFRCPYPARHANGDAHPSARWNPEKRTWFCDVCKAGGGFVDLARELGIELGNTHGDRRRIAATYDYRDEHGVLLYQVVRYEPKGFRQRRPDGRGGWIYNLDGVRLVPYRLPELLAAARDESVFVVEGEKDADTLAAQGLVASCNPMGAGKWRAEYNEHFQNRHVVVIPDADEPGRRHADGVVRHLLPVAASVRGLALDGAKDVSEWLRTGRTADELLALAHDAAVITEPPRRDSREQGLTFVSVGDLLGESDEGQEWLVDGLLLAGGFAALVGKPKAGKSTLARNLCKAVAQGETFLGRAVRQGRVLYLALEEQRSQVRAHFAALGVRPDALLYVFVGATPVDGLEQLRAALEREPAALVVIDPLFRFVRARDGNDYAAMIAALDPVLRLARDSGACVLVTHHAPKGERADIDAPIGSTAIAGSIDTLMVLKRCDRYRTLSSVQRTGDDLPDTVIELDPDTRAVRAAGTRQEADVAGVKTAIAEYLSALNEAVDEPTINQHVEGRNAVKREALRALVAAGTVNRSGSGKRGDPYRYAVSCTLVPAICGGQENENPESAESPQFSSLFSCPRVSQDPRDLDTTRGQESTPPERASDREVIELNL